MKKILILYFSGVGVTKCVSQKLFQCLHSKFAAELYSIEKLPIGLDISQYDAFVIGYPVYHTHPAKPIMDYFKSIQRLPTPIPAFVFNTRGLYSANSNRILAKCLAKKNIRTIMWKTYRGPASDGSLLAPGIKRFFGFEPHLDQKLAQDCNQFAKLLRQKKHSNQLPPFKLYSILNAPNKLAGQLITFPIYLHKEHCSRCGKCIRNCPADALVADTKRYPKFDSKKCVKCYRCIHHCPSHALSLTRKRRPQEVIHI